jgi:hypothetical protein
MDMRAVHWGLSMFQSNLENRLRLPSRILERTVVGEDQGQLTTLQRPGPGTVVHLEVNLTGQIDLR